MTIRIFEVGFPLGEENMKLLTLILSTALILPVLAKDVYSLPDVKISHQKTPTVVKVEKESWQDSSRTIIDKAESEREIASTKETSRDPSSAKVKEPEPRVKLDYWFFDKF